MTNTTNNFSNVSEFFRDFSVPCTCGAVAFAGIFDRPDDTFGMGGTNVQTTNYTLLVQASTVADAHIDSGVALSVQAVAYTVRDVIALDDGAIFQLTLTKQ